MLSSLLKYFDSTPAPNEGILIRLARIQNLLPGVALCVAIWRHLLAD